MADINASIAEARTSLPLGSGAAGGAGDPRGAEGGRGADEASILVGTRPYLSFRLGEDSFALDVSEVEVVLEWCHVTRVPKAPPYMRGVINHRGSVVPVVDLKRRFGLGETAEGEGTSIIVMDIAYENDRVHLGVLADGVEEVLGIDAAAVETAPEYGSRRAAKFIRGMARRGEGFILLLDMDRAFVQADAGEGVEA